MNRTLVDAFEAWVKPKFARFVTPKEDPKSVVLVLAKAEE
jgi:hypothetical protein